MEKRIYTERTDDIYMDRVFRDYDYTMLYNHTHQDFEIYYLLEGERYYFIENRIYHVKKGSLVFINQNSIHKTVQYGNARHERILLQIKEEPLTSCLSLTGELKLQNFFAEHQGVLEIPEEKQGETETLLDRLHQELRCKKTGYRMVCLWLLGYLLLTAQRLWEKEAPDSLSLLSTAVSHQKVSEAAEYITRHYGEVKSLEDVARHFYISKSYLSRIFKESTGYTVNEYINVTRIQKARQLLDHTKMSITEISQLLGYESITYFERVFRKYADASPREYKKRRFPPD